MRDPDDRYDKRDAYDDIDGPGPADDLTDDRLADYVDLFLSAVDLAAYPFWRTDRIAAPITEQRLLDAAGASDRAVCDRAGRCPCPDHYGDLCADWQSD